MARRSQPGLEHGGRDRIGPRPLGDAFGNLADRNDAEKQ
jgi:hypothetical protein